MSSLLEDPPMPTRSRGWGHYLLPALVLLNVLLMLSLLGVLPPVFGDQPDPGRLSRQIDADRVRVVPGGAAAAEAASSAHSAAAAQEGDKQADAAPQGTASSPVGGPGRAPARIGQRPGQECIRPAGGFRTDGRSAACRPVGRVPQQHIGRRLGTPSAGRQPPSGSAGRQPQQQLNAGPAP